METDTECDQVLHGFYSAQAARYFGICWYLNEKGEEVEVTAVERTSTAEHYAWPDKQYVGVVTKYVREVPGICRLDPEKVNKWH